MSLESENYTRAKEQYKKLNEMYQGKAGMDLANQMAQEGAEQQAVNASQQAQAAARNAGMSKAQSAAMGAQNVENVYSGALQQNKEQALAKQQQDLAAQQTQAEQVSTDPTAWDYVNAIGDVASKGAQVVGQAATGFGKIGK